MKDLIIDYNNLMAAVIGPLHGLLESEIEALQQKTTLIHQDILEKRKAGSLAFMDLPYQNESLIALITIAEDIAAKCENYVVLGIGGSALGTRSLAQALLPPMYNLRDREGRRGRPKLFVADNIDPDAFAGILEVCPLEKTTFNIISKSGGTAETMSQFLIVRDRLISELGKRGYKDRMIATTDPKGGMLREIAERDGLSTFEVPPGVGGRFSVFTSVGLLPLAVAGIDPTGLLAGAARMDERIQTDDLRYNPAYLLGALWYLMHKTKNKNIMVMMPYASSLLELAEWFQQLWAESLGKEKSLSGETVHAGSTPVRALGATDQHSQLQLYNEGPFDKVVNFISTLGFNDSGEIPQAFEDIEGVGYLGGHNLAELIAAERRATELALTKQCRPNLHILLPAIDAASLGQLMYMLEVATVFAGGLYDVNPLDQPGVEAGKKLAFGMMGRKGFEDQARQVEDFSKSKTIFRV